MRSTLWRSATLASSLREALRVQERRHVEHETIEIVVVVALFGVVVRRPGRQIVLGRGSDAEKYRGFDPAFASRHDLDGARYDGPDLGRNGLKPLGARRGRPC